MAVHQHPEGLPDIIYLFLLIMDVTSKVPVKTNSD